MSTPDRFWIRCLVCKTYNQLAFAPPTNVYCESCGTIVGTTETPVEDEPCTLDGNCVVHADTGDVLAEVNWSQRKVEIG